MLGLLVSGPLFQTHHLKFRSAPRHLVLMWKVPNVDLEGLWLGTTVDLRKQGAKKDSESKNGSRQRTLPHLGLMRRSGGSFDSLVNKVWSNVEGSVGHVVRACVTDAGYSKGSGQVSTRPRSLNRSQLRWEENVSTDASRLLVPDRNMVAQGRSGWWRICVAPFGLQAL